MQKKTGELFRFIGKILIVLVLVVLTVGGYFSVQYLANKDKPSSFGPELYYALDLAKTNTGYENVIIGDSVARLIFAPEYQGETDKTCYLATNQAITVLGNYLLLNRYLENNPQTKEVTYILRPQSLANPLWFNYSFQYFVVPFYNEEFMELIKPETQDYIENRFGAIYATNNVVKKFTINTPYYLDVYLNNILEQQLEIRDEKHISDIAVEYLGLMKELCDSRGITLNVLAAPLPDTEDNHNWEDMKNVILANDKLAFMQDFFDGIDYYDEGFFMDEAHFTEEYLSENRDMIIDALFEDKVR